MSAGDAPAAVPAPIARLKDELAALERAYSPGHHGLWSARRRAELVDAALVELYAAATSAGDRAPRTALVALGGYGRGALCPAVGHRHRCCCTTGRIRPPSPR